MEPTITNNDISKTCIQLLLKEPFYGHYLTGVPKEVSTKVDTAAVALMKRELVKLMVNPAFWESLTEEKRYGLVKHEVLHLVFKHLLKMSGFRNKALYNVAADLVVNQYISRIQLPDGAITLERLWYLKPAFGIALEPNMDVGYYYHQLSKILSQLPKKSFNDLVEKLDEKEQSPQAIIDISVLLKGEHPEIKKHEFWKAFEELSPAEIKIMEQQVNNNLKQAVERVKQKSSFYGHLPNGLIERLDQLMEAMKPQFNWKRILRLFAATSNSTYVKNTLRRPSKRYGTTPGIRIMRRNRLLVAVDTSGSIQMAELKVFFSEIYHLWKQGAEVWVVECDAAIQNSYPYRGVTPTEIRGRGGTHFDPPIEYANTVYRPDAIVYFTDGYAGAPQIKSRCPIMWLISSTGLEENSDGWRNLPGQKLKISI